MDTVETLTVSVLVALVMIIFVASVKMRVERYRIEQERRRIRELYDRRARQARLRDEIVSEIEKDSP